MEIAVSLACVQKSNRRLGRREKAIQSFQEELRFHPENSYADECLGDVYVGLKDYSAALFHYKRALSHSGSSNVEKIRKTISSIEMAQKNKVRNG